MLLIKTCFYPEIIGLVIFWQNLGAIAVRISLLLVELVAIMGGGKRCQ
ncbi:hypothetical protein [[Limnothrix rosea] IAM M-220]|nr:hypothetical protein [[Limnothrix rosea] IAM M-220]